MVKWEFKTVKLYALQTVKEWDTELGYWGNENWELVSVVPCGGSFRALLRRSLPVGLGSPKREAELIAGPNGPG